MLLAARVGRMREDGGVVHPFAAAIRSHILFIDEQVAGKLAVG
jgi:hypothetical protein